MVDAFRRLVPQANRERIFELGLLASSTKFADEALDAALTFVRAVAAQKRRGSRCREARRERSREARLAVRRPRSGGPMLGRSLGALALRLECYVGHALQGTQHVRQKAAIALRRSASPASTPDRRPMRSVPNARERLRGQRLRDERLSRSRSYMRRGASPRLKVCAASPAMNCSNSTRSMPQASAI